LADRAEETMRNQPVPGLSAELVRAALADIREVLDDDLIHHLTEAAGDSELWTRAAALPRDYLARRGIELPARIEIDLNRPKAWPGRCCFKICRSVDPFPPPPDPSGIFFCVYLCLPCRPDRPPIPPRPVNRS
jgi:hypothetical protein